MITKNNISKYFENSYPSLGKVTKIEILGQTNINSQNYLVKTPKGNYVLRNFSDSSSSEKVEKMFEIVNFCRKHRAKVLNPIKNISSVYVDQKKRAYVTHYQEGTTYNGGKIQLKDVAKNLAVLHKILAQIPLQYNFRTNQKYYRILSPLEFIKIKKIIENKKIDKNDRLINRNLDFIIQSEKEHKKTSKVIKIKKFKNQLIHCDFHPSNVIFKKDKVAAIIDFDSMRMGKKMEDIAFASVRFASYGTSDFNKIKNKIRIFLNTYLLYNEIDNEQISYFDYFFTQEMLRRLSYILRKRYFYDVNKWTWDFNKFSNYLKLVNKKTLLD